MIQKWVRPAFLLLLLAMSGTCIAQKVLVLEKLGRGRHYFYFEGDRISLETKQEHWRITDIIYEINDSSIVLGIDLTVPLSDIYSITRQYRNRVKNGVTTAAGGIVLIGITSINNALHDDPVIDPVYASIGLGLFGAGVLWAASGTRNYKVRGLWTLKVLESEVVIPQK